MIVTDGLPPKSPTTTSTSVSSPVQRTEFGATSGNPPPPAYDADEETVPFLPNTQHAEPPKNIHEPAEKRFVKAFAVAMLIYLTLGSLVLSVNVDYEITPPFRWGAAPSPPRDDADFSNCGLTWGEEQILIPVSSDLDTTLSYEAEFLPEIKPPYSSRTSVELVAAAPLLYFISRGSLAEGKITYDVGTEDLGDKVKVDIERRYWSHEARDRANVCVLQKDEGASGLGIYTPNKWPHHADVADRVIFNIKVTLPGRPAQPRKLNSLSAFMPLFRQTFGNLENAVSFESIDIRTSDSGISAESLNANYVKFTSSNAGISGKFNVTEALSLQTSDGKIDAHIQMLNEDRHVPTCVKLLTSNARIAATASLYSSREYGSNGNGGYFKLDARTSNGALDLRVPTAPSLSHLTLTGSTSNAGAHLKLPIEYEGTISATTSNGAATIDIDTMVTDPTGDGLERKFQSLGPTATTANAAVWWGTHSEHRDLGSAGLVTSNGNCVVEG